MFSRSCTHDVEYRVIDVHDDTVICKNCALVIETSTYNYSTLELQNRSYGFIEHEELKNYTAEKISEWIHRLKLDDCILRECMYLFNKEYISKTKNRNTNLIDKYIALTIYEVILNCNITLSLDEILVFSVNTYREIWQLAKREKRTYILSHQISTKQYIDRYISHLNISTKEKPLIYAQCKKYDRYQTFSPKTRCGACFYDFLYNKSTQNTKKKQMNLLRCISKLLNISVLSIRKLSTLTYQEEKEEKKKKEAGSKNKPNSFSL